uniref:Uncharacterized protein n=1 Tax=Haptolina ericina TaxID=156174 RepID=A0A7S3AXC6_9EUKA
MPRNPPRCRPGCPATDPPPHHETPPHSAMCLRPRPMRASPAFSPHLSAFHAFHATLSWEALLPSTGGTSLSIPLPATDVSAMRWAPSGMHLTDRPKNPELLSPG